MSVAAMSKAQERLLKQGLKNVQRAKTPEDVLGVDPGASEKEIKEAYREMSLLFHPDKISGAITKEDASEAQKKINNAKESLLDRPLPSAPPVRPKKKKTPSVPKRSSGPAAMAPALRIVTFDDASVTLECDGTGPFELQFREAGLSWTTREVSSRDVRKRKLKPRTKYDFRVRVAAKGGAYARIPASPYSPEVSVTTLAPRAPAPPATPQKTKRPRAPDANTPQPKRARATPATSGAKPPPGHFRLAAKVALVRRTEFSGGHRCEMRLEQPDPRWATRKVLWFDRDDSSEEYDFDAGAVYSLTGNVKTDHFGGSLQLVLSNKALRLDPSTDTHRVCQDCGGARIPVDEPGWKKQCLDCWRANH